MEGYRPGTSRRNELSAGTWPIETTPEEILVLAAVAGDISSFDELARRWRPAVARTVGRIIGDRDARDDTVQEVFVQVFRYLPKLGSPQAFPSWLRRIALRLAHRRGREERARTSRLTALDEVVLAACPAIGSAPEADLLERVENERLREGIETLPETLRETVELRFFSDMRLAEIAAYQGISRDGVKWRLREALRRLRETYQPSE
jgi:RNA polymerase sigma factor (sigma-70 family)